MAEIGDKIKAKVRIDTWPYVTTKTGVYRIDDGKAILLDRDVIYFILLYLWGNRSGKDIQKR